MHLAVALCSLALLTVPVSAKAQSFGKMARIGVLLLNPPTTTTAVLWDGVRDLGYVEGRDFVREVRWSDGRRERLPELADLGLRHRLPIVSGVREYADAGGLATYGPSLAGMYRRIATHYVDRILKGTKPADLPIEQPMKLELVINLKTAKALGLTIPPSVLARADEVIK
jgi:putative ABC transport system substrate-binding protein